MASKTDPIYVVTWIDINDAATLFTATELADWMAADNDPGLIQYTHRWEFDGEVWEAS